MLFYERSATTLQKFIYHFKEFRVAKMKNNRSLLNFVNQIKIYKNKINLELKNSFDIIKNSFDIIKMYFDIF